MPEVRSRRRFLRQFGVPFLLGTLILIGYWLWDWKQSRVVSPIQHTLTLSEQHSKGFLIVWGNTRASYKATLKVERWYPETLQVELRNRSPHDIEVKTIEVELLDEQGKLLGRYSQSGPYLQSFRTELVELYIREHPAFHTTRQVGVSIVDAKPSLATMLEYSWTYIVGSHVQSRPSGVLIYAGKIDEAGLKKMVLRAKVVGD